MVSRKNEKALKKNAHDTPRVARTRPPRAGPKARAALNCAELRVTALRSSRRGTTSVTNACHDATVRPETQALAVTRTMSTPTLRTPATQVSHRPTVNAPWTADPATSTVRRSNRSAMEPPMGPSTRSGRVAMNPVNPSHAPLPVSPNTTNGTAIICSQFPVLDSSEDVQMSEKLRIRKASKAPTRSGTSGRSADDPPSAAASAAGAGSGAASVVIAVDPTGASGPADRPAHQSSQSAHSCAPRSCHSSTVRP